MLRGARIENLVGVVRFGDKLWTPGGCYNAMRNDVRFLHGKPSRRGEQRAGDVRLIVIKLYNQYNEHI